MALRTSAIRGVGDGIGNVGGGVVGDGVGGFGAVGSEVDLH